MAGPPFDGDRSNVVTLPRAPSAVGAGPPSSQGQPGGRSRRSDWDCTKVRLDGCLLPQVISANLPVMPKKVTNWDNRAEEPLAQTKVVIGDGCYRLLVTILTKETGGRCITQVAKMSIDPKFVELTSDAVRILL